MSKSSTSAPRAQRYNAASAARTAKHMVAKAFEQDELLHVFTTPDLGPPIYTTFDRSQRAEAEKWTFDVLMSGVAFFRSETGEPRA